MRCAVTLLCERLQKDVVRQLFSDAVGSSAGRTPEETARTGDRLHNRDRISCYTETVMPLVEVHKEQYATSLDVGFHKRESGKAKKPHSEEENTWRTVTLLAGSHKRQPGQNAI